MNLFTIFHVRNLFILGVISRMDLKANPCEDFYQYSCGGWLEKVAIPDSKSRYSTFSEVSSRNKKTIKQEVNRLINKQKNSSVSSNLCILTGHRSRVIGRN